MTKKNRSKNYTITNKKFGNSWKKKGILWYDKKKGTFKIGGKEYDTEKYSFSSKKN